MAHMLDTSKGRAAIAYVGETPWHDLGNRLTAGQDIETWRRESGLDYEVERADVQFVPKAGGIARMADRQVLYRSDTQTPLSVVSKYYQVVQPAEILNFFAELVQHNSFELETAGALDGGKRIWALARVNDGECLLETDRIRPYVLLATSYDSSLSTTAKFTGIRVVCHNTLTMAAGYGDQKASEADEAGSVIRIGHNAKFNAKDVRMDLGIVFDHWERFLATSRKLARQKVNDEFATAFLKMLLPVPVEPKPEQGKPPKPARPVEETKAFKSIMALFQGGAIGSELPEANGTAFGLLNAVTEYVDHVRGGDDTRLASAWFGAGDSMKNSAFKILADTVK
jgi:phage/plasmid-like protein (TIGR03299 family)